MRNEVLSGMKKGTDLDPAGYAEWLAGQPGYEKFKFEDILAAAQYAKSDIVESKLGGPSSSGPAKIGGLFGQGGSATPIGGGFSLLRSLSSEATFGTTPGQPSTASTIDWGTFGSELAGYLGGSKGSPLY